MTTGADAIVPPWPSNAFQVWPEFFNPETSMPNLVSMPVRESNPSTSVFGRTQPPSPNQMPPLASSNCAYCAG
jgi:hypothetical protein